MRTRTRDHKILQSFLTQLFFTMNAYGSFAPQPGQNHDAVKVGLAAGAAVGVLAYMLAAASGQTSSASAFSTVGLSQSVQRAPLAASVPVTQYARVTTTYGAQPSINSQASYEEPVPSPMAQGFSLSSMLMAVTAVASASAALVWRSFSRAGYSSVGSQIINVDLVEEPQFKQEFIITEVLQ